MEEEMVSGPDLGAGFLFQLTRARRPPEATFTYHAQDGGADAGGPPIGDPGPFGWDRASSMCDFGGRVCWHRTFRTADREAGSVRTAYHRTRFVMETQLAQAYRGRPVPWEPELREWCERIAPALDADRVPWWIEGPAARAVASGGGTVPAITVRTTEPGVARVAALVPELLIEPPARTFWAGQPVLGARAFFGTFQAGTRVEWAAAPPPGPGGPLEPIRRIGWSGFTVPVVSPA